MISSILYKSRVHMYSRFIFCNLIFYKLYNIEMKKI
nr:MAG TPA: hypothetical protein [Caudoviricetes sp.]